MLPSVFFSGYEARGWCASRSLAQRTRLLGFKKNKKATEYWRAPRGGAQANKQFFLGAKVDVLSGYDKVNVIWSSRGRPVSSPGVTDSVTAYGRTERNFGY